MDIPVTMIEIKPLQIGDHVAPPILQSYYYWKRVFKLQIPDLFWLVRGMQAAGYTFPGTYFSLMKAQGDMYGNDWCNICHAQGARWDSRGYYYCLCSLLQKRDELEAIARPWISSWYRQSLDQLVVPNTQVELTTHSISKAKTAIGEWMVEPRTSLVLSGPTGVGKTHILNAILAEWYPWFIPVVASDFERNLREGLQNNNIQTMMSAWLNHPGLIFDDLGLEYASSWIMQKMEDLFEYRLRKSHWWDYITVVATNIRKKDILARFSRDGVSRLGSRITDNEIVTWIGIEADDYRNRKRT